MAKKKLLFDGSDWDFNIIDKTYEEIEKICTEELGCDPYVNQLEVITSEQMLDAYSSIGLPLSYSHWSHGKTWAQYERQYSKGQTSLAYELVINSNPCINYLMEENSMTTQALVLAHAAFGHNHFFKHNYLFKTWTDADSIIDYLVFVKKYVKQCEEKYGLDEVETFLDSLHTLKEYGIYKYKRPPKLNAAEELKEQEDREKFLQEQVNDLWRTLPNLKSKEEREEKLKGQIGSPEENILYFLEKNAPNLKPWQRELCRIVRKISIYFYPQGQTKIMNEGFACFVHYYTMNRLYDKGLIGESTMFEFLKLHTNVLYQPTYDKKWFSGMNPYSIGFAMFMDIKRICENPTKEDKEWFPDIAGTEWKETILDIVDNYRDESFILQFLSPKVIRDFKFFLLEDSAGVIEFQVSAIHNTNGYKRIRKELAKQQEYNHRVPNIQIIDCDLLDTRDLILGYKMSDGKELHEKDMDQVLLHVKQIWGYDIILELWKDDKKIGQKSTDAKKVESVKSTTQNPFAYGMFTNPGYI